MITKDSIPIHRQALGRVAYMGSLYDASQDQFCHRSVFKDQAPKETIINSPYLDVDTKIEVNSSIVDKLDLLKVDLSLKISLLSGKVGSFGVVGKYLNSTSNVSQTIKGSFIHRSTLQYEELLISHEKLKELLDKSALEINYATHVVTGIRRGVDVFVDLTGTQTTTESNFELAGGIEASLNKLLASVGNIEITASKSSSSTSEQPSTATPASTVSAESSGNVAPNVMMTRHEKTKTFEYVIRIYGDLNIPTCPKSLEELIGIMPQIAADIRNISHEKARPLEYTMLPIKDITSALGCSIEISRMYQPLDEDLDMKYKALGIQNILCRLSDLGSEIFELVQRMKHSSEYFLGKELEQIKTHYSQFRSCFDDVSHRLGDKLVQFRRGIEGSKDSLSKTISQLESTLEKQEMLMTNFDLKDINYRLLLAEELKKKHVQVIVSKQSLQCIQLQNLKAAIVMLSTNAKSRQNKFWITIYLYFIHMQTDTAWKNSIFVYQDLDVYQQQDSVALTCATISIYKKTAMVRQIESSEFLNFSFPRASAVPRSTTSVILQCIQNNTTRGVNVLVELSSTVTTRLTRNERQYVNWELPLLSSNKGLIVNNNGPIIWIVHHHGHIQTSVNQGRTWINACSASIGERFDMFINDGGATFTQILED